MKISPFSSSSELLGIRILTKDEAVWLEQLSVGSCSDGVHGAGLQVDHHCPRHVARLRPRGRLIEVDVDPLQLQVWRRRAFTRIVDARPVQTVLVGDNLPELS